MTALLKNLNYNRNLTKLYKMLKIAKDKIKGKTLKKGSELMIKKIAWDAFKNTGDINAFLELKQIENIENNIKEVQEITNLNLEKDGKTE